METPSSVLIINDIKGLAELKLFWNVLYSSPFIKKVKKKGKNTVLLLKWLTATESYICKFI